MRGRALRVLIATTDYPPEVGGIQHMTEQIALHLATRHRVAVVAPQQRGAAAYDAAMPCRVVRFPRERIGMARLAALAVVILAEMRRERPDVVLCSHVFAAIALRPICRLLGVP